MVLFCAMKGLSGNSFAPCYGLSLEKGRGEWACGVDAIVGGLVLPTVVGILFTVRYL